jgi:hypothetical protein
MFLPSLFISIEGSQFPFTDLYNNNLGFWILNCKITFIKPFPTRAASLLICVGIQNVNIGKFYNRKFLKLGINLDF